MKTFDKLMCGIAFWAMTTGGVGQMHAQQSIQPASNTNAIPVAGTSTGSAAAPTSSSTTECVAGQGVGGHFGAGGFVGGNDGNCGPATHTPCPEIGPSNECIGAVGPNGQRHMPFRAIGYAAGDHFSPDPLYAYGGAGLDATRVDNWNRNYAAPQYAWHGNYRYWRWGTPTALVVPPTAAFQSEYNWGVAQTRSMPIYHQFTGAGGAGIGGSAQGGLFRPTPYRPSSTSHFGIYPVRGPW